MMCLFFPHTSEFLRSSSGMVFQDHLIKLTSPWRKDCTEERTLLRILLVEFPDDWN